MRRFDLGDLSGRYAAGESPHAIAESLGVSTNAVFANLKRAGVKLRTVQDAQRLRFGTPAFDEDKAVADFLAGTPVNTISKATGVSRPAINRVLRQRGIPIRDRSAAGFVRMAAMSQEQRLALTENAHAAVRGVPQSEEYRVKVALTREEKPVPPTEYESQFAALMFTFHDIVMCRQKAIGRYNADFAIAESSVAVEIFGGHWHAHGRHAAIYRKRLDHFLDSGWLPVIIWVTKKFPVDRRAAHYVASVHERRRKGEPFGRQEHVIRGDGYRDAVVERDAVDRPRVPCLKAADHPDGNDLGAG